MSVDTEGCVASRGADDGVLASSKVTTHPRYVQRGSESGAAPLWLPLYQDDHWPLPRSAARSPDAARLVDEVVSTVRATLVARGHATANLPSSSLSLLRTPTGGMRLEATARFDDSHDLPIIGPEIDGCSCSATPRAFADDLATILPRLATVETELTRLASSVARARARALGDVAEAYQMVSLAAIAVGALAADGWRDAVNSTKAVFSIIALDGSLVRRPHTFEVATPREVGVALRSVMRLQPERIARYNQFRAPGPRFTVDQVTVDLIASTGHDPIDVLRLFKKVCREEFVIPIGNQFRIMVVESKADRVRSDVTMEDEGASVEWDGSRLNVKRSKRLVRRAKVGASASLIADHPAFALRRIRSVEALPTTDACRILLDEPLLQFDADAGTLI